MLHHLIRSVQELVIRELRHETGNDPDVSEMEVSRNRANEMPFMASFQVKTFGPQGTTVYIVSITETVVR